jgi:hypothetical protein
LTSRLPGVARGALAGVDALDSFAVVELLVVPFADVAVSLLDVVDVCVVPDVLDGDEFVTGTETVGVVTLKSAPLLVTEPALLVATTV